MHSFLRIFKFSLQKFWRNAWLSVVTITVLMLALLAVNAVIAFQYMADASIELIRAKVDMSVHFRKGVTEVEVDGVRNFLKNLSFVESVEYVSPQRALEAFRARHSASPDILNSLDELDRNPLSPALIIRAREVKDYETLFGILSDDVYSNSIATTTFDDYRELIGRINELVTKARRVGYLISGLFVSMAVLIMFNTVRINVYTHREEIGIMKLVGATNMFVRAPFLLESLLVGFLAVTSTILVIYPVLSFMQPYIELFFGGSFNLAHDFERDFFSIFGAQLFGVAFINILASGSAIRRYLNV